MAGILRIYEGGDARTDPARVAAWLADPPPWRLLAHTDIVVRAENPVMDGPTSRRGSTYVPSGLEEIARVNMGLLLRRPLLVTGRPGLGKTTLAYNIAWCLGFGPPLRWEINSQSTLRDGLYHYDAIAHLQSAQTGNPARLSEFITLGPLGTALLPTALPRVLLVDEIDKASFDLPHDLLHVFEEGSFVIPELLRAGGVEHVIPFDPQAQGERVPVVGGRVHTRHHPVVVMTSNGERNFPEAFLRRCVLLELKRPSIEAFLTIVRNQLGDAVLPDLIRGTHASLSDQATDVLLQSLFLQTHFGAGSEEAADGLRR